MHKSVHALDLESWAELIPRFARLANPEYQIAKVLRRKANVEQKKFGQKRKKLLFPPRPLPPSPVRLTASPLVLSRPIVQLPRRICFQLAALLKRGIQYIERDFACIWFPSLSGGWKPGLHAASPTTLCHPLPSLASPAVRFPGDPHSLAAWPGWSSVRVGQRRSRQGYRLQPPCMRTGHRLPQWNPFTLLSASVWCTQSVYIAQPALQVPQCQVLHPQTLSIYSNRPFYFILQQLQDAARFIFILQQLHVLHKNGHVTLCTSWMNLQSFHNGCLEKNIVLGWKDEILNITNPTCVKAAIVKKPPVPLTITCPAYATKNSSATCPMQLLDQRSATRTLQHIFWNLQSWSLGAFKSTQDHLTWQANCARATIRLHSLNQLNRSKWHVMGCKPALVISSQTDSKSMLK